MTFDLTMFIELLPQNEKEEALTTNVWIEMVIFHISFVANVSFFLSLLSNNGQFMHLNGSQAYSVSVCSNGVTTGSGGTSRPGRLCMATSRLRCASPPKASGCLTSYWRTSECARLHL